MKKLKYAVHAYAWTPRMMRARQLSVLLLLSAGIVAGQSGMRPFAVDWRNNGRDLASVAFLLDAPAGHAGFIQSRGGHLVKPDGERFRIWGVNLTGPANLPSKNDAPMVAAHLAGMGLNCVRFHLLDQRAPLGILDASRNDTQALDARQMDKLDFFIAELKKRGIYSDLNLNVGRVYEEGDGVREFEYLGYAKGVTYFDERLLVLQREYARQLLTHHNPYTRSEYRNEPAVAIVELVNENSLIHAWLRGRLQGNNTRKNRDTWPDITASYERDLTRKYQTWLAAKGYAAVPRLRPSEFASAPVERFRREATFYMELEDTYFQSMRRLLKEELGLRALIIGTSDFEPAGYAMLRSASRLDVVDAHDYWQHPRYTTDWGTALGFRRAFEIANTPMVNEPLRSTVVRLSRSAVAGKPFIVSEMNHSFPSEYACEGIPILAAYGAFHDWDGIIWYNFESIDPSQWDASIRLWFNIRADPVKTAQVVSGALTFLRPDVKPAAQTVTRTYTLEQVLESLRLPATESPYFTPSFPRDIPLRHATRIGGFDGPTTAKFESPGGQPFVCDTNEIEWGNGAVRVDTARTQALVGFSKAFSRAPANFSADVNNPFAAITLVSMDAAPIAQAARLLLTTGSRVANSAMKWNAKRTGLEAWGTAPTVIEPVTGTITLTNLKGATNVRLTPLDGGGGSIGRAIPARKTENGWRLAIGEATTVWYLVQVDR